MQTHRRESAQTTIAELKALRNERVPFPIKDTFQISVIHPNSEVAYADFCRVLREPYIRCVSIPVRITSPTEIIKAIDEARGDILAIVRGGVEGLEAFDNKLVTEALSKAASKQMYRVLGIGHSVNSSLADVVVEYAADVPSAAGSHVRKMIDEVRKKLEEGTKHRTENDRLKQALARSQAQPRAAPYVSHPALPRQLAKTSTLIWAFLGGMVFISLLVHFLWH